MNAADAARNTPLHTAATMSECGANFTRILLQQGAQPAIKNAQGDMAHHLAAYGGHTGALHHLLRVGCPMNAENGYSETALSLVITVKRYSVILMLLSHGARLDAPFGAGIGTINFLFDVPQRALLVYQALTESGNANQDLLRHYTDILLNSFARREHIRRAICGIRKEVRSLRALSRRCLRRQLIHVSEGRSLWKRTQCLPLPALLLDYLLLGDFTRAIVSDKFVHQ